MFYKIAWRNIWRNKRRTIITISSIFFAVFFAVAMRSIQLGMYDKMIESIVAFYTGYGQVQAKGFYEERSLDYTMDYDPNLISKIESTDNVNTAAPRLESFALCSDDELSKVGMVVGMDMDKEKELINLKGKLSSGDYLNNEQEGILVGEGMADYFNLTVGDTLVMIGQGYRGATAAGKYEIKGLLDMNSPDLNKAIVVMPLAQAQELYNCHDKVSSLVLGFDNPAKLDKSLEELRSVIDNEELTVMSWLDLLPELIQIIQTDNIGGLITLFILYMIISFGIFGTILMMTAERQFEFGVLISVGMKRAKLIFTILLEVVMMAIIGAILGGLVSAPIVYYFNRNPISMGEQFQEMTEKFGMEAVIQSSTDPMIPITHGLVIFFISLCLVIYPAIKISRLKPVTAMRK